MTSARAIVAKLSPLLACLGLLAVWQVAALWLDTESFPTAWHALQTTDRWARLLAALAVLAFGWLRQLNPNVTRGLMLASTAVLVLLGVIFILQGIGVLQ